MRFLRLPEVRKRVGLSKPEIYRRVKAGRFPAPHRISHKVSVWPEPAVVEWQKRQMEDANG